jgi:8-oxo-dGTP diphosphatase
MENNIILQNASGAFLINNGHYLLMRRSPTREIAPNLWSCVGGFIDEKELNNPLETCLREITEETGITNEHIFNLELKYIIIRRYKNIIRQNYIYFGETDINEFKNTEEGTLHWIKEEELLTLEYTKTYTEMIKHYLKNKNRLNDKIAVGVAGNELSQLKMNWSIVEDFE